MRLVSGLQTIDHVAGGSVATIGNFDGVHRGHQQVIQQLAAEGRKRGLPVVVLLFEPQPREFFFPEGSPARLTRLREKLMQLGRLPVDLVLLLRFNHDLADLPAEVFVRRILVDRLNVKFLVVGDDFRFGRHRAGDFAHLCEAGEKYGFRVRDTESVIQDGQRISSTLIREALADDRFDTAELLLGRPYSMCGRVVPGDQRGRQLGFPTANIAVARRNAPLHGVFAVTMQGFGEMPLPGVANIGFRPTIQGSRQLLLEVHLLDFADDLYGRRLEVCFHRKLRNERKFFDLSALREQIASDVKAARGYFSPR
ncbi:MAG: bifunctional riboflavin kinase/FAD synthetase [Methylotetracoccus sp.]|jgi:riboflavin kinase/FMN adenylyltransferase|nr:bifunctional riboflavin kinase/FAD synthetase [Methylotetracoccus sp.]